MTPKNRTLEGKNRTLVGDGGVKNCQKLSKIVGHHPLYGSCDQKESTKTYVPGVQSRSIGV